MGFAVYHLEKGTGNSAQIGKHIDRKEEVSHTYQHADGKTQNVDLTPPKWKDKALHECVNERIKEGYTGQKEIRKDAVKFLTHVLTGSHDEMKDIFSDEKKANDWCQKNYDFLEKEFGAKNIVRFTLHLDEKTPHIHAVTVPLTEDGRLSAKDVVGNKTGMSERQDRYAKEMENFGLERGIKATGIKHETAREYYGRINKIEETKEQIIQKLDSVFENNKITKTDIFTLEKRNNEFKAVLSDFIQKEVQNVGKDEIMRNQALKNEIKDIQKDLAYSKFVEIATIVKKDTNILDYFTNKVNNGHLRFEGRKGNEFYFATPHQKTGSIAVNPQKQTFFDHQEGKGGDIFKAIGRFENLEKFNQQVNFALENSNSIVNKSIPYIQQSKDTITENNQKAQITAVFDEIKHPALKQYMNQRGLATSAALKEVHWNVGEKSFFALGFKNNSGGFDLRNEHFKGKIGTNDITTGAIGKDNTKIAIFEGMSDFLSYRKNNPTQNMDYIVLNSTSNTEKAILTLKNNSSSDKSISLLLDKDEAGNKATKLFQANFKDTTDMRSSYIKEAKDLCEHYTIKSQTQEKTKNQGMSR